MPAQVDSGADRPMTWRDRAKNQMNTAHPTAKTAETQGTAKTDETPTASVRLDLCLVTTCQNEATDSYLIYCAEHRVMADDGTLWLRCVFDAGHAPVAPNDLIACAGHRAEVDREMAALVARTGHMRERRQTPEIQLLPPTQSAPAIGRDDLLILAELRGWEGLPLGPGVSAGGTEAMWRTFTASVQPAQLRTAVSAAWECWGDTIAVLAADAGARQESAA